MKKFFCLFFLANILTATYSQEEYSREIKWMDGIQTETAGGLEIKYLYFPGSEFGQQSYSLPYYVECFEFKQAVAGLDVKISDEVYIRIPDSLLSEIDGMSIIPEMLEFNVEKQKIPNKTVFLLRLLPFRYNNTLNQFEMLVSFNFELEKKIELQNASVNSKNSFAQNSVLSDGEWLKLRVSETGVHKIDYNDLVEAGLAVENIVPEKIRLFANGSGMVPERNSRERMDDLIENAIYVYGEADGSFDNDDYILFFAESSTKWSYNLFKQIFEHETNIYDDHTYYFLNFNLTEGKRIENIPYSYNEPNFTVTSFHDYFLYENDLINLTKSGKLWVGEEFNEVLEQTFSFSFPHLIKGAPIEMLIGYAVRSGEQSTFDFYNNDDFIAETDLSSVNLGSPRFGHVSDKNYDFYSDSDDLELKVKYNAPDNSSFLWLDFIQLNLKRDLIYYNKQLYFRNIESVKPYWISKFIVSDVHQGVNIWEVTDKYNTKSLEVLFEGDELSFVLPTDTLRQFIVWESANLLKPEILDDVPNQNLHAFQPVDYIIVAPEIFYDAAAELAQLHNQTEGLSSVIVTPGQIYNEFSSGAQDPSAIRDFVRMLYERGGAESKPSYLLLFGDGSYDPKNRDGVFNSFIPAYESNESLLMTSSYTTDDFYGLLDSTEGYNAESGRVDIGIGRFPVSTVEQAWDVVNKIKHYITGIPQIQGDWRNNITFIADDEDGNTHLNQAEQLVEIFDTSYKSFQPAKIYLDAYKQQQISGGYRYPDVSDRILKVVDHGTLILNYTGHGGELGLSDEKVLDIPAINSMSNIDNLPLFITATCEFSRFDNPELTSAGELVLLNPHGGGIGLLTTTRLAFSTANFRLNQNFYLNSFSKIDGKYPRLGDIIRITKAKSNGILQKNIIFLGDPALRLAYPKNNVRTSELKVNNQAGEDTLSSLSLVRVKGEIADAEQNKISEFNGVLQVFIYDKPSVLSTLANDEESIETSFLMQDRILFKGPVTIKEGEFEFTFVLPKDMDYNYGLGKILYYAKDTLNGSDANGYHEIVIGGTDGDASPDLSGPDINLFLNDLSFVSGDIIPNEPLLIANLKDQSGINYLSNGIGHDIILVIDNDKSESIKLNDYYVPNIDDYTNGIINYQLGELSQGNHSIEIQAWDSYNNSSKQSIDFVVDEQSFLDISELYNTPNPFSTETEINFKYEGKEAAYELEISFFTINGESVGKIKKSFASGSDYSELIRWNGKDKQGKKLDAGIYLYTINITNEKGYQSKASNKLVIIN